MSFLIYDKRNKISIVKVSLLVIICGALFIVGAGVALEVQRQTLRQPLFPDLPEGAQQWGVIEAYRPGAQNVYYTVPGEDVEGIVAHYRSIAAARGNDEKCVRTPAVGNFPDYQPGNGFVPYTYSCLMANSSFDADQSTEVTVQPGVFNEDPNLNSDGSVVIVYQQTWTQ